MRRFLSVLFCLSFFISFSQLKSLNIGKVADKDYLSIIRFEMIGDKLIVPVTIEGKRYRFLFDTGAPNIISSTLDSILQPEVIGTIPTTDASGKRNRLKVVAVESLSFGDIQFEGTASLVYDLDDSELFSCFDIDGFIGSNMLRKSIIQIDTKTKTMVLTDKQSNLSLNKKEAEKLMLTKNQSSPYVWIELGGKEAMREQLLIDTGADDVYDLSKQKYNYFKEKKIFEVLAEAEGASSVSLFGDAPVESHHKLLLPKLTISDFELNDIVTITTNDNNSRLGAEILRYGKITLDFKNKRFYFHPHDDPFPIKRYEYGFSSTYLNNRLTVGFVWDKELQEMITYGDQIIAINGIEIGDDNLCDLVADRIDARKNEVLTLKIRNAEGETEELILKGTIFKSKN